jgi:hypothetical protein
MSVQWWVPQQPMTELVIPTLRQGRCFSKSHPEVIYNLPLPSSLPTHHTSRIPITSVQLNSHQPINQHGSSTWRICPSPAHRARRKARDHSPGPPCFDSCCSPSSRASAAGAGSYTPGTRSVWANGIDCCVSDSALCTWSSKMPLHPHRSIHD